LQTPSKVFPSGLKTTGGITFPSSSSVFRVVRSFSSSAEEPIALVSVQQMTASQRIGCCRIVNLPLRVIKSQLLLQINIGDDRPLGIDHDQVTMAFLVAIQQQKLLVR
jgi:hypothetical protein